MKPISEMTLTEKATHAMEAAVEKVIAEHRRQNRPLAIYRDGQAIWVTADELAPLPPPRLPPPPKTDDSRNPPPLKTPEMPA
jgi:hypothetical protein